MASTAIGMLVLSTPALGARTDSVVRLLHDPAGDAHGQGDITGVIVAADTAKGRILFRITVANRTRFRPGDQLRILVDADENQSTGEDGIDYEFVDDATGWDFAKWSASRASFVYATHGPIRVAGSSLKSSMEIAVELGRNDLGKSSRFGFWLRYESTAVVAPSSDDAPNHDLWTFDLSSSR
jgi:hypothetical protein